MENGGNSAEKLGTARSRKIVIEFDAVKRIARATPDLTIAQFVAVWTEKLNEEKRERDRDRKASEKAGNDAEQPGIGVELAGTPTQADHERALFEKGKAVLGRNANGMVAQLLKHHRYQTATVDHVLEQARAKGDPRGYIATILRRAQNGTGASLMDAFDKLDDRAASAAFGAGPEIRDVTPGSDQGG